MRADALTDSFFEELRRQDQREDERRRREPAPDLRLQPEVPALETERLPDESVAPHITRLLVTSKKPRAVSTLDARLQHFVTDLLARQLAALASEEVRDGAALVVDNASGEVLAYVGNSGNGYVDGVRAQRQAGSTLKPFLYGMAIESRLLTAASPLDDSPVNLITPTGLYVPSNYENDYKGLVSVRNSLASSLNNRPSAL